MKPAKEVRVGNIIMVDGKPFIVLRSDINGSSRTGFTYKWKMKNLLTNSPMENVFRGDDKFDVVVLDKKPVTFSYFADPLFVFMDEEYNQYEIEEENLTVTNIAILELVTRHGDNSLDTYHREIVKSSAYTTLDPLEWEAPSTWKLVNRSPCLQ